MPQLIQRSFVSGEIAPALRARADLNKYITGLALCENFFIRPQGGAYNRAGMRFVGEVADSTERARLIPFSFNTEQTYMIVANGSKFQFVQDGAFLLDGSNRVEVATPYSQTDIIDMQYAQSADVLTLTEQAHAVMNLNRLGQTNWTLTAVSYAPTQAAPEAPTLVATGDGAGDFERPYRYVVAAEDEDGVESLASPSATITTPSLSQTAGVQLTWTAVTGAVRYRVYKDPSENSGIFGWIGDTENLSFTDYNFAPLTSDAPQQDRQPISTAGNYPAAVAYYQQRQVFANTLTEPQAFYTTQTANFRSFRRSTPTRSTDAVTQSIVANQVNEIRHIIPLETMLILTSGGEWKVTEGDTEVFAPDTVGVRVQSYNGSSKVRPAVVNNSVLYVQEKGAKVRDIESDFGSVGRFGGTDLSIMAEHLFEGREIVELAYAEVPYGILWCVRDDGVLLGLTYQKEHQVWAWHQHKTDGLVESVAVVAEDDRDAPYVIVRRNINGVDRRYVERLEPRIDTVPEDCFYLDSGVTQTYATPTTVIEGLGHLENETITMVVDGNVVTNQLVTGGRTTLLRGGVKVHAGLPYTCAMETLDIDPVAGAESIKPKKVTVARVDLAVERTRGAWIGPATLNETQTGSRAEPYEAKIRYDADGYGPVQLKSGLIEVRIDMGWPSGGGIRIEQRSPMPLAVLAAMPEVTVGG